MGRTSFGSLQVPSDKGEDRASGVTHVMVDLCFKVFTLGG